MGKPETPDLHTHHSIDGKMLATILLTTAGVSTIQTIVLGLIALSLGKDAQEAVNAVSAGVALTGIISVAIGLCMRRTREHVCEVLGRDEG